jgi:hypothetical protein
MPTTHDYRKALSMRQPFWEQLSPTAIKQRIDQIIASPQSAALVQALTPVEFALLLKESSDMRPVLLELAHPKQIRLVFDLDCWQKDTLQSPKVLAWIEELQRSGSDVFVQALQALDTELLIATCRKHIRVQAALPLEEEEPAPYDEVLANELYRVEFIDAESPLNESIVRLLNALRMTDLDSYHGLMQSVMWGQDSEAEEWAYRWKSGRLQDEGFPDYYDALETYRLADLDHPPSASTSPPQAPGVPESAEESGLIPTYAWSLTPAGSPLAQALQGDFSAETQERLCWEMVYLCNRELVVDQVDFASPTAVRASLLRVHAYLNMGIEYLQSQGTHPLASLLTTHSLQALFQWGFTLSMRLHQRALRLQTHLHGATGTRRALPGLARHVLDGLLGRQPQFFEGLEYPGSIMYRDFVHMRDITLVDPVLTWIENHPAYCRIQATSS